jgi:hypothetical protein
VLAALDAIVALAAGLFTELPKASYFAESTAAGAAEEEEQARQATVAAALAKRVEENDADDAAADYDDIWNRIRDGALGGRSAAAGEARRVLQAELKSARAHAADLFALLPRRSPGGALATNAPAAGAESATGALGVLGDAAMEGIMGELRRWRDLLNSPAATDALDL